MAFATLHTGLAALLAALVFAPLASTSSLARPAQDVAQEAALEKLVQALKEQDVHLDPKAGALWIPIRVEVRDELLEYLLVGSAGALHESFFSTAVPASVLNTALLALGMHAGQNAAWRPKDPRPTEEELRAGAVPYEVTLPQGDGLELYVAWRQAEELHFYRVEDLLRNLLSGASMQRHRWVYLGSKLLPPDPRKKNAQGEQFAADVYQNLINVAYFSEAYTLVTAALPECVEQTIWLPNAWLVPQRGTQVALFFARTHLDAIPPSLAAGLPHVDPAARDARKLVQPGAGSTPKEGR
ncbi:MAG TPA: YdjY domain-containing protein [Planctomycetota bacterium]|nr:YdjY domain-containing protein [Planctomycetota bacterium]